MNNKLYLVDPAAERTARLQFADYSVLDYKYSGERASEMQDNALVTEVTLDMSDPNVGDLSVSTLYLSTGVFSKLEKAAAAFGYEVEEWK